MLLFDSGFMETVRRAFRRALLLIAVAVLIGPSTPVAAQTSFVTFESGPVRPLALSPDGSRLFVTNIPDATLEIFDVGPSGELTHSGSAPVGMEPVAVAARTNSEVWVANYLSDSVSIVDVSGTARVIRTLLVGDEPTDIVFAGSGGNRAFITTAHRGQSSPFPRSEYDSEGVGRADVWVFDALNLGSGLGGDALTVITLFGDKPRALAASADGGTVYAAIFHSGNQTTAINEQLVCDTSTPNINNETVQGPCLVEGVNMPGGSPPPHKNHEGIARPETGLILKFNRDGGTSDQWQDELGRDWNNAVRFDLPDQDVFAIDANASPPLEMSFFTQVGTILFNMAVNPVSGKVYVSNTDAQNHVRFEGPGTHATGIKPPGEPITVRGHLGEARITVIDGSTVTPRHLNKHIDYSAVPVPAGIEEDSLATPLEMAVTPDGNTLYVAAFGSSKIGVFDTASLENDTFTPNSNDHIVISGGGPSGIVLDGNRLYTMSRFNNSVVVVDLTQGMVGAEVQSLPLHNPEPASVVEGRPLLYDAILTGSNGEASCSSCHIFGDFDSLAWDLGNPDDDEVPNTNPFTVGSGGPFHPMKGPMTTQSLRGLANMGPQHWRGDRQGDEVAAFNAFNVAFPGLVGRDEGEFSIADMQKFTDFALQITYPPNPIRQLDNSLRSDEQDGFDRYFGADTDGGTNCNGCHTLNAANGFFGGDGNSSVEGETQEFKIPHLRNLYQKIGMFGMAEVDALNGDFSHQGDQVRGFGFLHDGAIDTVARFVGANAFSLNLAEEADMEAFMIAFDSDLPPMVGQQITRTSTNGAIVDPRIDAMIAAASAFYPSNLLGPGATQCDVIVKGALNGNQRGGVLVNGNQILPDDGTAAVAESAVRNLSNTAGQESTYSCVPFGSGVRMGVDRDLDGFFNFVEIQTGTDPADPTNFPGVCGNGATEPGLGEACDDGDDNGTSSSCCDATCQFKANGAASCDGNSCTRTDTCTNGVCTPGGCADGDACSVCGGTCDDAGTSCDCVF
jgi:YVTN family beta-propeller protein